jgi:hypothetical protein
MSSSPHGALRERTASTKSSIEAKPGFSILGTAMEGFDLWSFVFILGFGADSAEGERADRQNEQKVTEGHDTGNTAIFPAMLQKPGWRSFIHSSEPAEK